MSADRIEIIHVEFDNDAAKPGKYSPVSELYYAEWRRNGGEIESAHAKPHKASRNEGDDHLIPDDVRVALALLVAPGLVEGRSVSDKLAEALKDTAETLQFAGEKLGLPGEGDGADRRADASDDLGILPTLINARKALVEAKR